VAEDALAVSRSKRFVGENYWPWVEFGPVYGAIDAELRLANGSCMELACLGITKFYNELLAHCCRHDGTISQVTENGCSETSCILQRPMQIPTALVPIDATAIYPLSST